MHTHLKRKKSEKHAQLVSGTPVSEYQNQFSRWRREQEHT